MRKYSLPLARGAFSNRSKSQLNKKNCVVGCVLAQSRRRGCLVLGSGIHDSPKFFVTQDKLSSKGTTTAYAPEAVGAEDNLLLPFSGSPPRFTRHEVALAIPLANRLLRGSFHRDGENYGVSGVAFSLRSQADEIVVNSLFTEEIFAKTFQRLYAQGVCPHVVYPTASLEVCSLKSHIAGYHDNSFRE